MAGPNDISALRGIIGDGVSMNNEEMKAHILGRKFDKKLEHPPIPKFPMDKEFTFFKGNNKSPLDVMAKFSLNRNKTYDSTTPHVVNTILRDNYGLNKMANITTTDRTERDRVAAQLLNTEGNKVVQVTIPNESKDENEIRTNDSKELKELKKQRAIVKQQKDIAKYQSEILKAQKEGREASVPLERGYTYKTIKTGTRQLPQLNEGTTFLGLMTGKDKLKFNPTTVQGSITVPVPTKSGLRNFAAGLADNLGTSIAQPGTFIGSFDDRSSQGKIRTAQLQLKAYQDTLKKRHPSGGMMTAGEQLRLQKLQQVAQQQSAQAGFMGTGSSGRGIIQGSRPTNDISRFTQIGSSRQSYGSYAPEAMGRLSVNQTLQADSRNKWGTSLGGMSTGQEKITNILGKQPDPTGETESASAKIKRFAGI